MVFSSTLNIILTTVVLSLVLAAGASTGAKTDTQMFLYFAYGSNLLKERLQLKNPSATVQCVAKLQDYKLVFGNHKGLVSERWPGGVASIEPSGRDTVWGVVWKINTGHLTNLDSYTMNSRVQAPPSPHYLKVIMMGAEQNSLPKAYQDKLKSVKTNKYDGPLPVMDEVYAALKNSKKD